MDPRLSWQCAVGCHSVPTAASQLRHSQSQSYSQGGCGHRATRDGTSSSSKLLGLCSPGQCKPPTGKGRAHMNRTPPIMFMLAMRELLPSARTHWKLNRNPPVWQPKCENLGASFIHSYLRSIIKELNIMYFFLNVFLLGHSASEKSQYVFWLKQESLSRYFFHACCGRSCVAKGINGFCPSTFL